MKNRLLTILLAAAVVCTLSACGTEAVSTNVAESKTADTSASQTTSGASAGSSAGSSSNSSASSSSSASSVSSSSSPAADGSAKEETALSKAYHEVVTNIVMGYKTDWADNTPDSLGLSQVYNYQSQYMGYLIKDIDGDGQDELIIGENIDGDDSGTMIYDVYSGDADGNAVHVFCGGERDFMHITSDGILVEHGSNSASDSIDRAYRIQSGKLVETDMPSDPKFATLELDLITNYV